MEKETTEMITGIFSFLLIGPTIIIISKALNLQDSGSFFLVSILVVFLWCILFGKDDGFY